MYTSFYALSARPFDLTPDPDFLYLSRNHKEALAHLTYGVESKTGFVMVTGEVGAGKTTLLRTLIASLGDQVVLSQVTNTRVSYKELLELILEDFGLNPRGLNKTALLSTLNDFLVEKYQEGKNCVLIVDEAQNLGAPTLEGVRMLSNLETEKAKLLHTILSGQPNLRDLIDSPELEQLRQRITVRYHLGPLSVGEVGEYIRHRLGKVVTDEERAPVFPEGAVPKIHRVTGGIPRLINVLCDASLLHGYVEEKKVIDQSIIDEVAEQVSRDQQGREPVAEKDEADGAPAVDSRIAQIEARLEAVLADVNRAPPVVASSADVAQQAQLVTGKERELEARRAALDHRLAEVEKRETEFNRRLNRVKTEWKKRMQQLEVSRRAILKGADRFPPLKVYVCDPDPRIQNSVADLLDEAGIVSEMHGDYGNFADALRESGAGGWFAVAVLGSEVDDSENLSRVSSLCSELSHVPTVFLSDMDLSTVRRQIFSAGASHFLEKPNGRASSFTTHREAMENFKSDLLRTVQALHRQYRAFFSTFVVEDGETSKPLS
jgi:putative secretion ATPase (PEP-CTERM system associated)